MPLETIVQKTIEYLAVPSVVGYEKLFIDYLYQDFIRLGLSVQKHDGILEVNGKQPHAHIVTAHLDRHGLISLGDGTYAYAAEYINNTRYNEDHVSSQAMLRAIGKRFEGELMYAYNPATGDHLGEGLIERAPSFGQGGDAYFSIQNMSDIPKGTPIAYARKAEIDKDYFKGQIDNTLSLGVIYTLFQNGFQGTALLSCEEEIGKSWQYITRWLAQNSIRTHKLFVLDTSPYREKDPVDCGWVTLRSRDKSGIFNSDLLTTLKDKCDTLNIPYQIKDEFFLSLGLSVDDLGSTELGRIIQNTNGKWSGITVQIPTTEYHTSYETTSKQSIAHYYRLLSNLLIATPATIKTLEKQ